MQKQLGRLLMATALIHNALGLALFWRPLRDMAGAGLFNSVAPHYDRAAVFWFLMFGVLLWLLGYVAHWSLTQHGTVPAGLGWGLLALGVVGCVILPVSGFWLVLPQAYGLIRAAPAAAAQRMQQVGR